MYKKKELIYYLNVFIIDLYSFHIKLLIYSLTIRKIVSISFGLESNITFMLLNEYVI